MRLLNNVLQITLSIIKDDRLDYHRASLIYAGLFGEIAWYGYGLFKPSEKHPSYEEDRQMMADLYLYARIVEARRNTNFPTWEGILLVRDHELLDQPSDIEVE